MGNEASKTNLETQHDAFWIQNFYFPVLCVIRDIECAVDEQQKDTILLDRRSNLEYRDGLIFQTALSRREYRVNVSELKSYLEERWQGLKGNPKEAREMTKKFHKVFMTGGSLRSKSECPALHQSFEEWGKVPREERKKVFCRQLANQWSVCKGCLERPILYNVLKDEEAMRAHLKEHQHESEGAPEKELYELLLGSVGSFR